MQKITYPKFCRHMETQWTEKMGSISAKVTDNLLQGMMVVAASMAATPTVWEWP